MSASRLSPTFIHHLRNKGRWGWLLALCWLFLNAQLALAGHQCDMAISHVSPSMQHQAHLQQAAAQASHPDAVSKHKAEQASPLCEKHCVPDTIKQDSSPPLLLAIPVDHQLALAAQPQEAICASHAWFSPPVAGPPAEIRFCRFIE
ncbi:hypothetical protein JHU04_000098 [Brenneria sp. 4F2]|nr:hypothetical protein [Brenneria bubanii]